MPRSALVDGYVRRGLSSEAVAQELGCSSQKVRDDLRYYGIPLRGPGAAPLGLEALDAQELEALYIDQGLTLAQIAQDYGCSPSAVKTRLARFGIARRPPGGRSRSEFPALSVATLKDLYVSQGLTIAEVARRVGRSPDVVSAALDAHGIPRNPRRQPRPPLEEEVLRRLWVQEGRTEAEVAAELCVSREWLRQELARHKIRRPRGHPPSLPLPTRELLDELYVRRRLTLDQAAAELGCSRYLVAKGLRAVGIAVRPRNGGAVRPAAELTKEVLYNLYVRRDLSAQAVAAELGVSPARVRSELRRFAIPVRRPGARAVDPPAIPARTLRRLYVTEALPIPEIALRYHTTANQVRLRLRTLGIRRPAVAPPHTKPPAVPSRELLEQLYMTEGLTSEAIARRLSTSSPTVRGWLRAAGIPVKERTTRATRRDVPEELLSELYLVRELSIDELAARLGTTSIIVRRSLHAHGLPVRPGGPRSRRRVISGDGITVLRELYADPDVRALLRRYGLPRRAAPGPLAVRFPEPIRPSVELLREAYEQVGLAAGHIELLTGQPADQVLDALHRAGIAVRHASGASPWRRRLQARGK